MKKSTKALLAALALPTMVYSGLTLYSLSRIELTANGPKKSEDLAMYRQMDGLDEPLTTIVDQEIEVSKDLKVAMNGAEVRLTFAAARTDKAHVRVQSATPTLAKVVLDAKTIAVEPSQGGKALRVDLELPQEFASLALKIEASRCPESMSPVLKAKRLRLEIGAANCSWNINRIEASDFEIQVGAGTLAMTSPELILHHGKFRVATGELKLSLGTLKLEPSADAQLDFETAVGSTEIEIDDGPGFSVVGRTNVGQVEYENGRDRKSISGMNQEFTVELDHAPTLQLKADMGHLRFITRRSRVL